MSWIQLKGTWLQTDPADFTYYTGGSTTEVVFPDHTDTNCEQWEHSQWLWETDNQAHITTGNTSEFTVHIPINIEIPSEAWQTFAETDTNRIFQVWAEPVADRVRRNVERSRKVRETERGLALLHTILSESEWADYRRHGSVRVVGTDGRLYEVGNGDLVYVISVDGKALEARCWHVPGSYCRADRIAGAVLALKTDAGAYAKFGNVNALGAHEPERVQARRAFRRAA